MTEFAVACPLIMVSQEEVRQKAVKALGSEEEAHRWLKRPQRALGGCDPQTLLQSESGRRQLVILLAHLAVATYS